MLASSLAGFNPAWLAPLGGILGGFAAVLGYRRLHKQDRETKTFIEALQQDEILGHKNIPGVPDKPSISERFASMDDRQSRTDIAVQQMSKELHPNGGSSMLDTVNQTYRLAQEAALDAATAAKVLAERERMRIAGEALLRDRIRKHPEMKELNDLLDVLPPPTEGS